MEPGLPALEASVLQALPLYAFFTEEILQPVICTSFMLIIFIC